VAEAMRLPAGNAAQSKGNSMKVLTALTARIVAAYVSNHTVAEADMPELIRNIHDTLARLSGNGENAPAEGRRAKPAVPIGASVTPTHIICLEDGKKFKSLKRHLRAQYGLSPAQYRDKWGLPADYPMVAPRYSKTRSRLAKEFGLGRSGRKPAMSSVPETHSMPER
jgi:predicted transcriptional regulator